MLLDCAKAHADVGSQAGVDEGDVPVINVATEQFNIPCAFGKDEVIGEAFVVLEKVILDHIGFVSETKNKIAMAMVGVILHDVPEDWPITNRDHGLGHGFGKLAHAHAQSTTKENDFHRALISSGHGLILPITTSSSHVSPRK